MTVWYFKVIISFAQVWVSFFLLRMCKKKNEISGDPEKLYEYVQIVLFGLDQRASSLFFTKNDYN